MTEQQPEQQPEHRPENWPANWPTIAAHDVPAPPSTDRLRLEPLQPAHNERDHAAWMSSIDHIVATPGFGDGTWGADTWPFPMSAESNLADLEMHWREFRHGEAYAYTVLDPADDDVIGCVYVDPDTLESDATQATPATPATPGMAAMVRSWVRVSHAELDRELVDTVDAWLAGEWPFGRVRWPGRDVRR